ncbi:hypothetical protein FBU31_004741, partial [Coemansia sp. 'formosensis']
MPSIANEPAVSAPQANPASPSTGPTAPSLFPGPPSPAPHRQPHEHRQHYSPPPHYSPPQHYSYAYSPPLAAGSPTSALGFISTSPPAPMALTPVSASSVSGSGFAMIGAQIIGPGVVSSHGPAFAYYGSPSLSGSPPQSPLVQQLPPLVSAGTLPGVRDYEPAHIPARPHLGAPIVLDMGCSAEAVDSRNVYIRNLPEECTDSVLVRMASPYGIIESSKSIIHEVTGKCKGYGFVKYRTADQAERAIEAFNAQGLQSTLAKDSFKSKLKRLQDRSSANVYVSNLSPDIDEAGLVELIKPHPVVSARILRDTLTGQHKGAGFARMPDRDTALLVIEKLKNIRLVNAPGPLQPRIADSEGQKQLKKQVNGEGGRFDDVLVRSGATSPIVWSPVLVYSPAGSPPAPPPHGFDLLPAQRQMSTSPAEQRYVGAMPIHHHLQQASYSATPGMYAIPSAHYAGYASSGYASPVGFGSPMGYASPGYASPGYASPAGYTSPNGYASPGYASPNGYESPQMPASPQLAYTHQMPYGVYRVQNDMPPQSMQPMGHSGDYDEDVADQL